MEGREFGHVHVIKAERDNKITRLSDRLLRVAREPHHEETLYSESFGLDEIDCVGYSVETHTLLVKLQ